MTDRSDAIVLTWGNIGGQKRLVFEPLSNGRYELTEKVRTEGSWREIDSYPVERVSLEHRGYEWACRGP